MNNKHMGKYTSLFLSVTVAAVQLLGSWSVSASEDLEYAGTTQIGTNDVYLSAEISGAELVVEEVYAEEGTQLSAGDAILKLTDESYQEALASYEAAIIKADNALTDTQLEYDQGVLEAEYTCETAEADAKNAEYIRTYQTNEVETALSDHEKMLENIDDRITELEEGIADGSYDTSGSSSASGTSSGSNAGGTGNNKSGTKEQQTQTEKESESETDSTDQSDQSREENPGSTSSGTEDTHPGSNEKTTAELRQELTTKMSEAEEQAQKLTQELQSILESSDTEDIDESGYSVYKDQLQNIIDQLEADVKGQKQVQSVLASCDTGETDSGSVLTESIEGDQRVLDSLQEIQEKMSKYQTLITSVLNLWGNEDNTALVDKAILTDMSSYLSEQSEISELSVTLLEKYESEIQELEGKTGDGSGNNSSETEAGNTSAGENGTPANTENMGQSGSMNAASGGMGSVTGGSGNSGNMSDVTASEGGQEGSAGGAGAAGAGQNAQESLSGEEISLLGDTYDLSSEEQLLAREPSDNDDAQDLIEQLEDSREDVEMQYEELQRKEKIFALEIQHTYDTAVTAGKLAELTYQQEIEEWEETLAEAKQEKADMETQKAILDAMTDGTIYADQDGTVATISYEAGDVLSSDTPIISYYETDTVSITLEIDQEDIANISVGDAAEVRLAGAGRLEGTVTEKSTEPESGTSRTSVKYTATVSMDNTDGRLSDGMSATVTLSEDASADNEAEDNTGTDESTETDTEMDGEAVVNE